MTATNEAKAGDVAQRPTGLAMVTQFTELVTQVPVAADDDGSGIIARILEADTVDALAEDDGLPSSKDLAPFTCLIQQVTRRPSDHPSSTGFYLIVDGVIVNTGQVIKFSAGGEQTVAMLAKLHVLGALPCEVQFLEAQTKSGRTAVNARPIPNTSRPSRTA